ncbi:hypothetical protein EV663_102150 [Rhodovulum bhavnagarense]|uniref:Uncharacterized protein n=1 Tax=Rhodovulum bhavnagarense TaxID=992286 RepID=A0A4V2SWK4_9RHOB|nr:hypothetical protein [Rhodovulum bhavnagarense]TCP62306.1 hypothetical protein EV663_102150 [Rhodovulum bhavnagarense]
MMQVIIHSVAVVGLTGDPDRLGLGPGDPLRLQTETDGKIAVLARARPVPFRAFRRPRWVRLGHLGPTATGLVAPILGRGDQPRVRIVNVTSTRLGGPDIRLSVWAHTEPPQPAAPTPRIFSKSRIRERP